MARLHLRSIPFDTTVVQHRPLEGKRDGLILKTVKV